ncbi:unnamed protein product, partial [Polarella glacialis]
DKSPLQRRFQEALSACCGDLSSRSLQRDVKGLLASDALAKHALSSAVVQLCFRETSCGVPELFDVLRLLDKPIYDEVCQELAAALAEEIVEVGPIGIPTPRVLEVLRQMVGRGLVQVFGVVAIIEDLVKAWKQGIAEHPDLPPFLALLAVVALAVPRPDLPQAVAASPEVLRLLVERHQEAQLLRLVRMC